MSEQTQQHESLQPLQGPSDSPAQEIGTQPVPHGVEDRDRAPRKDMTNYLPNFVLSRELIPEMDHFPPGHRGASSHLEHNEFPELYAKTAGIDESDPLSHELLFTSTEPEALEELRQKYSVFTELENYGIEVIPFSVQEHSQKIYIFTPKIHGDSADKVAESNPVIRQQLDQANSGVIRFMRDKYQTGGTFPLDVQTIVQFMYGSYEGDNGRQRLIYVDIDPEYDRLIDAGEIDRYGGWVTQFISAGDDILSHEYSMGAQLPASRKEFFECIELLKADYPNAAEVIDNFTAYMHDPSFDYGLQWKKYTEARQAVLRFFNAKSERLI